jgi:hypothetical protein
MKKIIVILLAGLSFASAVLADINIGHSAEWLSHQSTVIGIAIPEEVGNVKGPGQVWFTRVRFVMNDVIKGPVTAGDKITVYDFSYNTNDVLNLAEASKAKTPLLLFCTVGKDLFHEIDGRYVLTETHQFKSAYYQGVSVSKLYTPDFHFVADFADLLKRTRAQVDREKDHRIRHLMGTVERGELEVPFESKIHRSLYAGSSCYIWVPVYKENRTEAPTTPPTVR